MFHLTALCSCLLTEYDKCHVKSIIHTADRDYQRVSPTQWALCQIGTASRAVSWNSEAFWCETVSCLGLRFQQASSDLALKNTLGYHMNVLTVLRNIEIQIATTNYTSTITLLYLNTFQAEASLRSCPMHQSFLFSLHMCIMQHTESYQSQESICIMSLTPS